MVRILSYWRENWSFPVLLGIVMLPGIISGTVAWLIFEWTGNFELSVIVLWVLLLFLTPPIEEEAVKFLNRRTEEIVRKQISSASESVSEKIRIVKDVTNKDGDDPERRELDELLDKFAEYGPESLTVVELRRLEYLMRKYRPMDDRVLLLAFAAVGMLLGYMLAKGSKS